MNQEDPDLFFAVGLLFGTVFLLAAAVAWYDLILQIVTRVGLFGSLGPISRPNSDTQTKANTQRQFEGQIVFVIVLSVITIVILWYYKPYGSAGTTKPHPYGFSEALADTSIIKTTLIPGVLI